jgi:hypothetical protein
VRSELLREPAEVHGERREHLSELVVDLAGDACALLLGHREQALRERPQLGAGSAQLLLDPAFFGRVVGRCHDYPHPYIMLPRHTMSLGASLIRA